VMLLKHIATRRQLPAQIKIGYRAQAREQSVSKSQNDQANA